MFRFFLLLFFIMKDFATNPIRSVKLFQTIELILLDLDLGMKNIKKNKEITTQS